MSLEEMTFKSAPIVSNNGCRGPTSKRFGRPLPRESNGCPSDSKVTHTFSSPGRLRVKLIDIPGVTAPTGREKCSPAIWTLLTVTLEPFVREIFAGVREQPAIAAVSARRTLL